MYKRMIVPLDGSELAEGVLPYARSLARALEGPVTLLQVIDPDIISAFTNPAHKRYFDNVAAGMKMNSADYLRKLAPSFAQPAKVDQLVEVGKAAETIVSKAGDDPGTLIAMATHGRSGFQRWILGSVAAKVLHATHNPLLLIRPREQSAPIHEEARLKSIVVPLDGSELAASVLPLVMELAKKMQAEIILLRAYALPLSVYGFSDEDYVPNMDELNAQVRLEAKEYLERTVEELKGKGMEKVSSVVVEGLGAAEIIEFAQKTPGNLVAMCTHGRSGVGRWVMGSVTERVVQYSGDPVLVIRAAS
jgi:nucleotide-binding universal stress UspA family protein